MYKKIENDKNAELDFFKATSNWGQGKIDLRSVVYYHHTATERGYISAKKPRAIQYYNGKYGAGFVEYLRKPKHPTTAIKNYYIFREDYKAYKK